QASAGLNALTHADFEALQRLNAAYRERFGFPLLICVREHTVGSILAWGAARLEHTREEELAIALGEIAKISALRLADLLGAAWAPPPPPPCATPRAGGPPPARAAGSGDPAGT